MLKEWVLNNVYWDGTVDFGEGMKGKIKKEREGLKFWEVRLIFGIEAFMGSYSGYSRA